MKSAFNEGYQAIACIVVSLILLEPNFASGQNGQRIALVIGVQNYTNVAPLRHPIQDAKDVSTMLKSAGFEVAELLDPRTKIEIKDALNNYYNLISNKRNSVGVIYYAGHGIQYNGENYLVPASANPLIPTDLMDQCVKLNSLLSLLNSK